MDTTAQETVETDSLGRRTAPRTKHSIEEKLRIVQETHVCGASVATVARRHCVVLYSGVQAAALSRVIDLLVRR